MVAFCPTPLLGLFVTIITPGTPNTHTRNHGVIENLRRITPRQYLSFAASRDFAIFAPRVFVSVNS